eukprot:6428083-Prymnesium_polylepis.1
MSGLAGLVSRARRCRRQGRRCRVCAARHCERPSEATCMILSCIPVSSVTIETTAATTGRAGRSPVG